MTSLMPIFAEYFICWWLTLFVVLPIGMRSQAEENQVVTGTISSAPARFRFWRVMAMTTVLSAAIYAVWYLVVYVFGLTALSFPRIVPDFGS
jgi:predicted secreted protein